MRVISLGSGSSGNALLLEAGPKGRTKILVDAGFNGKTLIERLRSIGVSPSQLQGILITQPTVTKFAHINATTAHAARATHLRHERQVAHTTLQPSRQVL